MRFGIFMAPFHEPGQNPTWTLERDLELIQWLDQLGYDEAWIGEHHSAGWEHIAAPEIFIAVAAERTKHIKLGTGVVSLPYHHPLMVADRIVLLDHLTRGRVLFGIGPGALVSDALMLGIDPTQLRPRMEEAFDVIMRLLTETEPITAKSDWFEMNEAMLQLRPYTQPHMPIAVASIQSPAGMTLAGKHGAGVLCFAVFQGIRGAVDIQAQWRIAEKAASDAGKKICRDELRLVLPVHLAEDRQEALDDVRQGSASFLTDYQHAILGRPLPDGPAETYVDTMVERGAWIVGTPDDCIAHMERLREASGGYGGLMVMHMEWTTREKVRHSYELLARYVMPRFQGSAVGVKGAYSRAVANAPHMQASAREAIERAHAAHEGQQ
ncbi:MAG TPA: LLM class flavin-dependent oxidoreductase [Chloroflexota bacterium]